MYRLTNIPRLMAVAVIGSCFVACADEDVNILPDNIAGTNEEGIGEMVQFASGTMENISRAGEARKYYMPDASRFVCRMYYKAQTGSEKYDTLGTDQTAWLKVKGNVGNSLYWNREYTEVPESIKGKGGVDDYGNDYSAPAFYWQNRKEHAFLAWTDLNKRTSIKGGPAQGQLKFNADTTYYVYTGNNVQKWVPKYYQIYGIDTKFASQAEMHRYVQEQSGTTTVGQTDEFKGLQDVITQSQDWTTEDVRNSYRYSYGWQYKSSEHYATTTYDTGDESTATTSEHGWVQHLMYFDKIDFDTNKLKGTEVPVYDTKDPDVKIFLKDAETGKYVCATEVRKNDDGEYIDAEDNVTTDPAEYSYNYYETDEDGNLHYDESNPRYTFYYKQFSEKESTKEVFEYPALAFDLTRKASMTSMNDQPDVVQALTIQAPTGATQESNRVNLYFKHQFSQVQVNVKNAADNSVTLTSGDIEKVELLGVTETGYVFPNLDPDGKVKDAAYQDIDYSKFTEAQLKDNQFGTSLQLFEQPAAETAYGYLKSFNAITFGQLQAIRITWKETDHNYVHAATYRIPNTELMNLKSGVRYVWNIEIRRGTLAIIRTEIVDWELPEDEPHNGSADGIIQN